MTEEPGFLGTPLRRREFVKKSALLGSGALAATQ